MQAITLSLEEQLMKYINDPKVIEKLLSHLDRHENISEEIFPYLGEKENDWYFSEHTLPKDTFIRRIPFYFHRSESMLGHLGELHHYVSGIFSESKYFYRTAEYIEQFTTLEDMHYRHLLEVEQIFNYSIKQTGFYARQNSSSNGLITWNLYIPSL